MKRHILFISTIILIIIAGCSKENELNNSVYISDYEYTDLPAYSEWGYNTFGAFYDRDVFISNSKVVPAKIIVSDSQMSFLLDGQKGTYDIESHDYKEMSIDFRISGLNPAIYNDLILLNDTVFDLTNADCKVLITIDTTKYSVKILSGELKFKRAQNLLVDTKHIEVILSGYFEFKVLINNKPITVSNGRFDVGIGPDNFYIL